MDRVDLFLAGLRLSWISPVCGGQTATMPVVL